MDLLTLCGFLLTVGWMARSVRPGLYSAAWGALRKFWKTSPAE